VKRFISEFFIAEAADKTGEAGAFFLEVNKAADRIHDLISLEQLGWFFTPLGFDDALVGDGYKGMEIPMTKAALHK